MGWPAASDVQLQEAASAYQSREQPIHAEEYSLSAEPFLTAVYKQTLFHAEIAGLAIKKYTKQIYLERLLDQTASPRLCFKHHFQEQKYLLNF